MSGKLTKFDTILIPETFTPTGPHADRLALLADELAYRTSTREEYQNGDCINFGSRDWRQISSKTYGEIKDAAENQGLIELNERYSSSDENSKGHPFPKSVRLVKKHREAALVPYTLTKPIKRNPNSQIRIDSDDDVGLWLAEKLSRSVLRSDLDLATIEVTCESQAARNYLRGSVQRLEQGRLHASRCAYGRFHSNFTNMKKQLRRELVWDGEPMIAIDITNSQPALIPYVVGRHIGEKGSGRYIGEESAVWFRMDTGIPVSVWKEIQCVAHSLRVLPGKFYEATSVALDQSGLTRNQLKTSFFESLYGEVKTTRNSEIFKLIESVSPWFADAILDMKKDNHAALAHALQKTESEIVIGGCCEALKKQQPDIPLITVHDEIMTTAEFETAVTVELQTSFLKTCGYLCSVSSTNDGRIPEAVIKVMSETV